MAHVKGERWKHKKWKGTSNEYANTENKKRRKWGKEKKQFIFINNDVHSHLSSMHRWMLNWIWCCQTHQSENEMRRNCEDGDGYNETARKEGEKKVYDSPIDKFMILLYSVCCRFILYPPSPSPPFHSMAKAIEENGGKKKRRKSSCVF